MVENFAPSIIAFVSQTGNVMKTTLAAAVGIALAEAGVPVLPWISIGSIGRSERRLIRGHATARR